MCRVSGVIVMMEFQGMVRLLLLSTDTGDSVDTVVADGWGWMWRDCTPEDMSGE